MVNTTPYRTTLVFIKDNDTNFRFSRVNPEATADDALTFARAFTILQRNPAHTFMKEVRTQLTRQD